MQVPIIELINHLSNEMAIFFDQKDNLERVILFHENGDIEFETMEEDVEIIRNLWEFFSQHDIDIMEYEMKSSMRVEDDNFITNLKFTIIRYEN